MIDLSANQLVIVQKILAEHLSTTKVWAFGSRIKGPTKPYSDLDLALLTEIPLTIRQQRELAEAFSDSDLPFKVDLIDWASCSNSFKQIILARYEEFPLLNKPLSAKTVE